MAVSFRIEMSSAPAFPLSPVMVRSTASGCPAVSWGGGWLSAGRLAYGSSAAVLSSGRGSARAIPQVVAHRLLPVGQQPGLSQHRHGPSAQRPRGPLRLHPAQLRLKGGGHELRAGAQPPQRLEGRRRVRGQGHHPQGRSGHQERRRPPHRALPRPVPFSSHALPPRFPGWKILCVRPPFYAGLFPAFVRGRAGGPASAPACDFLLCSPARDRLDHMPAASSQAGFPSACPQGKRTAGKPAVPARALSLDRLWDIQALNFSIVLKRAMAEGFPQASAV